MKMVPGGRRGGMRRMILKEKQLGLDNCLGCGASAVMGCIQHIFDPQKKLECVMGQIEAPGTKEECKQCLCDIVCRIGKGGKLFKFSINF